MSQCWMLDRCCKIMKKMWQTFMSIIGDSSYVKLPADDFEKEIGTEYFLVIFEGIWWKECSVCAWN